MQLRSLGYYLSLFLILGACSSNPLLVDPTASLDSDQLNQFIQTQKDRLVDYEQNAEAHYFLARAYFKKKLYFQAESHAQRATQLSPLVGHYFELAGDIAIQRERYGVALNTYKSAIRTEPKLISAYLKLALTYERIDDSERAISSIEEALQKDPHYIEGLYHLSRLNLKRREYLTASQLIDEVLTLEPQNQDAQLLKIRIQVQEGNYYHARVLIDQYLRKHPAEPAAMVELLHILYFQKKWEEASEQIKAIESLRVLTIEESLTYARILAAKGDVQSAELSLKNILQIHPLHAETMVELATLLIRENKWRQALIWLEQSLEVNSRLAHAHFLQAFVYFKLRNTLQGDLSLNQALVLDALNPTYQLLSLRRRMLKGEFAYVEEQIKELLTESPLNPEIMRLQADLAILQRKYPEAEKILRQIQVIHDSELSQFSLARVLYFRGKYRNAMTLTQELIKHPRVDWEVVYLHASILNRLGLFKKAQKLLEKRLSKKEGNGFLHRLAGDLYRYQQDEAKAQEIYLKGLEIFPRHLQLIEALSSSYIAMSKWEHSKEILLDALEEPTALETILIDRLVFVLWKLKDHKQRQYYLKRYHQLNDPIFTSQTTNMEDYMLFQMSSFFIEDYLSN